MRNIILSCFRKCVVWYGGVIPFRRRANLLPVVCAWCFRDAGSSAALSTRAVWIGLAECCCCIGPNDDWKIVCIVDDSSEDLLKAM